MSGATRGGVELAGVCWGPGVSGIRALWVPRQLREDSSDSDLETGPAPGLPVDDGWVWGRTSDGTPLRHRRESEAKR